MEYRYFPKTDIFPDRYLIFKWKLEVVGNSRIRCRQEMKKKIVFTLQHTLSKKSVSEQRLKKYYLEGEYFFLRFW